MNIWPRFWRDVSLTTIEEMTMDEELGRIMQRLEWSRDRERYSVAVDYVWATALLDHIAKQQAVIDAARFVIDCRNESADGRAMDALEAALDKLDAGG